jgi:hypothetical protein
MRSLGVISFLGITLAVGCLLDASSQPARAINCAQGICNSHTDVWRCELGEQNHLYLASCIWWNFKCDPTQKYFPQWDTSTEQAGTCVDVQANGNEYWYARAGNACPCLSSFPINGSNCEAIEEGIYPTKHSVVHYAVDLYSCE